MVYFCKWLDPLFLELPELFMVDFAFLIHYLLLYDIKLIEYLVWLHRGCFSDKFALVHFSCPDWAIPRSIFIFILVGKDFPSFGLWQNIRVLHLFLMRHLWVLRLLRSLG